MHPTEMCPLSALVHSHSQQKPLLNPCFSTQVPSFFLSKASSAKDTARITRLSALLAGKLSGDISVEVSGRTRTKPNGIEDKRAARGCGRYEYDGIRHGTA